VTAGELPRRARGSWLPHLQTLVADNREWVYRADGAYGRCRLRVWDTPDDGFFAIVTELGEGLSVTLAAASIYRVLAERYHEPFGLAELWPAGEGVDPELHVDLVLPPADGLPLSWARAWPVDEAHPRADLLGLWWECNSDQILTS
jgi:hypothetical protein